MYHLLGKPILTGDVTEFLPISALQLEDLLTGQVTELLPISASQPEDLWL
jgi:hypothetical protein